MELILTGDENIIKEELKKYSYDEKRISIVHAPDVITCNEVPTVAIRTKKESSLYQAVELTRTRDDICGFVSTGSTGAIIAGAVLRIGRIDGVIRPAFCPILPTMKNSMCGICDSGANVDVKPENLVQFALMGSIYMDKTIGIKNPRVALLNIGAEEAKGDELRKTTYPLLKNLKSINFVGNMEGRDLLSGDYDLVVGDGFACNVLLKSTEGACLEMLKMLKGIMTKSFKNKLGALLLKKSIYEFKDYMDYNNYGGGVMLGTKKIVVKGHGSSKSKAIKNCIIQAYTMEKNQLIKTIEEELKTVQATSKESTY